MLTIDFGPLGTCTSSARPAALYLVGRQVLAVVNFAPRNVVGVPSQCLVLGFETPEGVVLIYPERRVPNGARVSSPSPLRRRHWMNALMRSPPPIS